MYKNLKAELVRAEIDNQDLATLLNITPGTASLKVNGKTIITVSEAFAIQKYIYEKTKNMISIDELFKPA